MKKYIEKHVDRIVLILNILTITIIAYGLASCTVINENFYNSSTKYPMSLAQLENDCSKLTNVREIKDKELDKEGITLLQDERQFNYHAILISNTFYSCYAGSIYKIVSVVDEQFKSNIQDQFVKLYGSPSGVRRNDYYWLRGKNILSVQEKLLNGKITIMYFILSIQDEIMLKKKNDAKNTKSI